MKYNLVGVAPVLVHVSALVSGSSLHEIELLPGQLDPCLSSCFESNALEVCLISMIAPGAMVMKNTCSRPLPQDDRELWALTVLPVYGDDSVAKFRAQLHDDEQPPIFTAERKRESGVDNIIGVTGVMSGMVQ